MNIIGIDVSKNKLDCALIDNSNYEKFKFKVVSNSEEGFVTLIEWLAKHTKLSVSELVALVLVQGVKKALRFMERPLKLFVYLKAWWLR